MYTDMTHRFTHTHTQKMYTYTYFANKEANKENNPGWQIKIHFLFSCTKQISISKCSTYILANKLYKLSFTITKFDDQTYLIKDATEIYQLIL